MIAKFAAWFTQDRRRAIYGLFSALMALAVAFGLITQGDATTIDGVVSQIMAFLVSLMAFLNTPKTTPEIPVDTSTEETTQTAS